MLLRKTRVQSLRGKRDVYRGSAVKLGETSVTLQKFRGNLILTYSSILSYSTNVRIGNHFQIHRIQKKLRLPTTLSWEIPKGWVLQRNECVGPKSESHRAVPQEQPSRSSRTHGPECGWGWSTAGKTYEFTWLVGYLENTIDRYLHMWWDILEQID